MADLIPPGQSAQPTPPPPQQPVPSPQADPNNPANSTPASPANQAVDGADQGGPRAVGTQQDASDAAQQNDPTSVQAVTPTEQAEMNQFISRFTMMISSMVTQKPDPNDPNAPAPAKSMHDVVMQQLNDPKVPLPIAIGKVTANVAFLIAQQAMHQGITYDTNVLFHSCFECVALLYVMGNTAGIFKGVPPPTKPDENGQYEFTDQELHLLTSAQMQAVRFFATLEMKSGMISPAARKANLSFWQQQIQREQQTGAVNQEVMQRLQQSGLFDKGQSASANPDDAPQSVDQPQTPQAPAAPSSAGGPPPPMVPPGASPTGGQ